MAPAGLGLRPDCELVALGILEMEAPAAGKGIGRPHDPAAGRHHAPLDLGEVVGIEDHQWPARMDGTAGGEAAGEAPVIELAVAGPIVGEAPAEGPAVEGLCTGDVADVELDIVDAAILARCGHAVLTLPEGT